MGRKRADKSIDKACGIWMQAQRRKFRNENGSEYSDTQFANALGYFGKSQVGRVNAWLNGNGAPRGGVDLVRIANVLGPEIYEILGVEVPKCYEQ